MKTLTNSSALFKPHSSISHRGHQHKTHFISEHKPKKTLLHLSTRKLTHNIKYPKNDNKTITTTTTIHNPTYTNAISSNVVHYKVYEIAIDAFFTFLKHALNTNLYASIKQAFYTEISKATELCVKYRTNTNQSFTLYTHKHTSSISKALLTQQCNGGNDSNCGSNCINCGNSSSSSKPKKTNLKLSYDMYSSNNNSNSNTNSNSNYPKKRATKVSKSNNNINIYEQHNKDKNTNTNSNSNTRVNNSSNVSKKESKQHSLFTLTKHKMFLQSKTQSTSKSHSKSKERKHPQQQQQQDYFPLNIKLYNKLNREHNHHHHTTNNNNNVNDDINVVTPNTTVVPSLNIKLSHNKHSHFNMLYNSNYFNSSSLNNHNNNNNTNLTTSTNTNRQQQQQQHKCSVRKQKQTPTKAVVSTSTKTSKVTTQVTCKSCRERKSIQIGNDNNNNNNGSNNNEQGTQGCEKQNSEQLREIKSNLDEDLKVMFNFSYEGFLNKADSESQSKISEISGVSGDGLNAGGKRGKVNGGDVNKQEMIYKRKYDY